MSKTIVLFLSMLLMVIWIISNLYAIGITPGRTSINFEPNLHKKISFSILNSEHKEMSVVLSIRGNLSKYVTLNQTSVDFTASEESKSLSYEVNLPSSLRSPGKHRVEIIALELPKKFSETMSQNSMFMATVAVVTQLDIEVPYPNKYAEASVNVVSSPDKVVFVIPVINKGKLDIASAKARIDIYTKLNEKINTIETDSIPIKSLKREDLSAEWITTDVNPGDYFVKVTVFYDDNSINLEKSFKVGERTLEVVEIKVKNFHLGEIAKFNAIVENKWSEEIKNAYLEIKIYNNENEVMADFKSPTYNLPPLSQTEMVSYWDTAGVAEGEYDGNLKLIYEEQSLEKNINLKITEDNIEVLGLTGKVIVKRTGKSNLQTILIFVIVGLILMNIFWFIIIRKFLKNRK